MASRRDAPTSSSGISVLEYNANCIISVVLLVYVFLE